MTWSADNNSICSYLGTVTTDAKKMTRKLSNCSLISTNSILVDQHIKEDAETSGSHIGKELFNLSLNTSTKLQTSCSQNSQRLTPNLRLRLCITLAYWMMEEICNGIETMRNYNKLGGYDLRSLYSILAKDMICKGVVNGIWESGWNSKCWVKQSKL
ncbi:hypothetical protein FEM48_Zijuj12G0035800 [Ziziphus jujuba var. spinosa]|uniref:Uncharacterized protein n=1 Tax=Ziziphus jujuba var. spinosa TaxID=714518 RepID=A0A978UAY5_ZIZJJ|nr:hypothetical protein FEM48_Zijuj12G0035800 [Ziziphus jujuba var. spinosa]